MSLDIFFEVISALGKRIRVTNSHWNLITRRKHLEIAGLQLDVQETLIKPVTVRVSQDDETVYLYYRKVGNHYLCVVSKHFNGEGFIITCYLTDKLKEGIQVWPK